MAELAIGIAVVAVLGVVLAIAYCQWRVKVAEERMQRIVRRLETQPTSIVVAAARKASNGY